MKFNMTWEVSSLIAVILLTSPPLSAQQFGGFVSFQPREITPGAYLEFSSGKVAYRWSMGVPVMLHDIHNGGRSNLSFWSLYMAGIIGVEYLTAGDFEIQADSSGLTLPGIVLLVFPAVSNGMLSYNLLGKSVSEDSGVQIAPFIGWDTQLFEMRSLQWVRFAPYAGISFNRAFGSTSKGKKHWSVGLSLGVREDFDFVGRTEKRLAAFVSFEATIH
jgi:hypothetical protein